MEDLSIKRLASELAIEALAVLILPAAPRFDEKGLRSMPPEPSAYCLGSEFGAVVRRNVLWWTMDHAEVR
jgi:hypothetical protein